MGVRIPIDARLGIVALLAVIVLVLSLTLPSSPAPATPQDQNVQEAQTLSLAAVAAHATATDCWTVIDDTVYDLSGYVQVHPGGQVITKACGIDGTQLFATKDGRGKPHSTTAHQLLAQFRVGTIGETITPTDAAPQGPLPDDLRRALALFDDPTVKAFRLIIESGGKLYTVVFENGVLTMREGVDSTVPLGGAVNTTLPKTCTESTVAARHSTKSDCWILIDGNYYDVTSYIPIHPGGQSEITPYCGGKDATSAFSTKGGSGGTHSTFARSTLASFKVGTACVAQNATSPLTVSITAPTNGQQLAVGTTQVTLSAVTNRAATCKWNTKSKAYAGMTGTFDTTGGTSHTVTVAGLADASSYTRYVACKDANGVESAIASIAFSVAAPVPTGTLDMVEVATHNSQSDCWIVVSNKVYSVASYISIHPGGPTRIINVCGTDATTPFNTRGGSGTHSTTAKNLLAGFYIGDLAGTGGTGNTTGGGTGGGGSIPTVEEAIQAAYPGATIQEINEEDDGRKEVKINYQGNEMTVHLDANNNIV